MDTLATPSPVPAPAYSGRPACALCGADALANWRRRPTDDELALFQQAEESRRETRRLLADPQLPAPDFGPLPTAEETTMAVYACGPHAITLDSAALVHASSCTAPNEADLPHCDCTPETAPPAEPAPVSQLPEHWLPGGQ